MIPGSLGHATIRKTRGLHWHNSHSNNIEESMWLDGSSQDLSRSSFTLSSDGQKELIVSIWVKRLEFGRAQEIWILGNSSGITSYNDLIHANFNADDTLNFSVGTGGSSGGQIKPTRVFRDTGWYHLLFSFNSNTSIVNNLERLHLYVNGERQTDLATNTAVPDNQDVRGSLTGSADFRFGRNTHPSLNYFHKAYMAQACYLEGKSIQAGDYAVSDFLDTWAFGNNGTQFVPKKTSDISALASTVGGNSFCLDFADSSTFGNDISSNNNDLSDAGSPGAANQTVITPSKTYSIFNPLAHADNSFPGTFTTSEGNSKIVTNDSNVSVKTTLPFMMSGSDIIRAQFTFSTIGHGGCGITHSRHTAGTYHTNADSVAGKGEVGLCGNGALVIDGDFNNSYTSALSNGDVVDVIVNLNVGAVYFAVNGSLLGGATQSEIQAGTTTNAALVSSFVRRSAGEIFNFYAFQFNPTSSTIEYNSGQQAFTHSYSTITSLISLNTADLPAPEYQGIDYFDSTLYEGNGGGQRVGDFVPFTDVYNVSKSLIFNDDDTAFLQRTPSGAGNRKKFTLSTWFKRANITGATQWIFLCQNSGNNNLFGVYFNTSDQIVAGGEISGGGTGASITTNRTFKDTSQWYHLVVRVDTANATEANRLRIYINGVEQSLASATYRATTEDWLWNAASELHTIARGQAGGSASGTSSDFYLAQTVQIDNDTLGPDSFGQTDTSTNRWVPKDVSGLTFGTNGFYLDMAIAPGTGNGAGNDVSGNNNDFTESGFAAGDQSNDTPSNNLAVLDSVDTIGSATPTLSEGNLTYTGADNGGRYVSGFPLTSGKWYWEIDVATAGAFYPGFFTPAGIAFASATPWTNNAGSFLVNGINGHWLGANGDGTSILYSAASGASPSGGPGVFISSGDRMFFAYDADNKYAYLGEVGTGGSGSTLTYYGLNGTVTADPTSGEAGTGAAPFGLNTTGEDTFYFGAVSGGSSTVANFIFDPTKFNGTPPTGYKALTQDNKDGTDDKITAWAWIKNRDSTDSHILVDRVRGTGNVLHADDQTAAETAEVNTVQRFLQRGVQIGNDVQVNTVNESYVLWQWLVGTSASTGSTTSPAGTIASTTIVADAGHFSVGTYTGSGSNATVGHGLPGKPEMLLIKKRGDDGGNNWVTYHSGLVNQGTGYVDLGTNAAEGTLANMFNSTIPAATVFSIGTNTSTNDSGGSDTYVFYAFRSVPGVCKIGSYTGNGNNDGAYVNLGFKPKWVMVKSTTANRNWNVLDTTRNPINHPTSPSVLLPNSTAVDTAGQIGAFDILSDGFKPRDTAANSNASGETYIYLAMAEIGGNAAYPPIYGR